MAKPDSGLMSLADIPAAIGLLSRLPVRVDADNAATRGAKAAWAYPLVGAVLGVLIGLPASFLSTMLPPEILAAFILIGLVVLTGALHEDGLADTADGLWGAWERERRLEIMKDSQIGSYGVIALVLSLLLRWLGLVALVESDMMIAGLVAALALSRSTMPIVMAALPNARDSGLSKTVGRPSAETAGLGVLVGVGTALLCIGLSALPVILAVGLATFAVGAIARAKIGGQTGDILGAVQQVAEIVALVVLISIAR